LADHGAVPPGVDDPDVYAVRSGQIVLPKGADWVKSTTHLRKAFVEHAGLPMAMLGGLP
jgi:hypothetical protein